MAAAAADWNPVVTCTAANAAGSASSSAQITLNYPVPTITSILGTTTVDPTAYCDNDFTSSLPSNPGCFFSYTVQGSGYYPGGIFHTDFVPPQYPDTTLIAGTKFSQLFFTLTIDTPHYSPGPIHFTVSSPADGHGGGSATGIFWFLGNQNVSDQAGANLIFLDQGAQILRVYDQNGVEAQAVSYPGGLISDIAFDATTNYAIFTGTTGFRVDTEPFVSAGAGVFYTTPNIAMGTATAQGWGAVTEPYAGMVDIVDLTKVDVPLGNKPPLMQVAVGDQPWVIRGALIGGKPRFVVFNRGDLKLTLIDPTTGNPATAVLGSMTIANLTPANLLARGAGGWQVAVLGNTAAVLSKVDNTVVLT